MKITKCKYYRINFELDGLHYSLSDLDCYDGHCALICKESDYSKSFCHTTVQDIMKPFFKNEVIKNGNTYNQMININKFESFVREILSGIEYKDTIAYKEKLDMKRQEEIEYHLRCLKIFGYELSNGEMQV